MSMFAVIVAAVLASGAIVLFIQRAKQQQGPQQVPADEVSEVEVITEPVAVPVSDAQMGIRAFMKGRYEEAFKLLEPAGHEGNLRAQQFLAKMYYAGNGVPADREKYIYWMTRAAENGDRPSRIKVKKIKSGKA